MDVHDRLEKAWRLASTDLGITVERRGADLLILDFGERKGTLVSLTGNFQDLAARAEAAGCSWSALSESYLAYSRELFVETLDDWGWSGTGSPPSWYTGEPWSE